jgi:hypothetical protein
VEQLMEDDENRARLMAMTAAAAEPAGAA